MLTNHTNIKVNLVFTLCMVLSACARVETPFPFTPTAPAPATLIPEIKTASIAPTATKPSPTLTPIPSTTPTSSLPTQTATVNPDTRLTDQAYFRNATQIASFSATCAQYNLNDISLSPSGNWLAIPCGYNRNQTLEIKNKEGKQWVLHYKDYLSKEFTKDDNIPMGSLYPIHWTSDDTYLYFATYIAFDGGGTCLYGFWAHALFRINVNTGLVSAVLPPKASWIGYEIAFSPGGGKLAYIADNPTILDLRTGEKMTIHTDGWAAGNLTWSPDGTKLAYAVCKSMLVGNEPAVERSAIKIYTLETRKSITVLEVEKNFLNIEVQERNQTLKIANYDNQAGTVDYTYFDWSSGELTTPTPTPQP